MSILPSQTLVNEDISFYALNSAQGVVTTVSPGSNIIITGTLTDPIINAVGASINNSSRYGGKTVALSAPLLSNGFVNLFNITPTYFPNSNSSYFLSVNYYIGSAVCSNVTGGIGLTVYLGQEQLGASFISLVNQSTWANNSNVPNQACFTTTFLPSQFPGSNLTFTLENNTNGTLSNATVVFNGVSLTGLTTSNVVANNWP